jgi:hypothetical protein
MDYPQEQVDELKRYCEKVKLLPEGGVDFLFLETLRLPSVCTPSSCDGLLCPVAREGYPSRLYFSTKVSCPYERNWNVSEARIGEKNWFAFSWKIALENPTLLQMLLEHLAGFTRPK